MVKILFILLAHLPYIRAAPLFQYGSILMADEPHSKKPDDPSLWIYLGTAVILVLLGGAFAGLTIALMGQDEIYLQVIESSGEGSERKNAGKVLRLLNRGKHWVLVTLLLSNVITNETLPIVLDRSLGGGWPAVLSSTVLIVIFGEIAPQSICVRYGLPIGAWMSPCVLFLMFILSPVAWPTAKLLDYLLGEEHGTVYKKAGLKTLVTLHKTLGSTPSDRLNQDEVTIISAVLDLKEKSVGSIMTPMDDVFTMSSDTVLDEKTMDIILSAGYSRIPIHTPDNPLNFVGMLLVKILITYDPEDEKRVSEFALATLPETRPETSCLDIVNFFQEGKSHMVLVSDYPGENFGALGVVTLEDVIEELIGEEIIDESDVFVDVHKAIRRLAPAPKSRVPKGHVVVEPEASQAVAQESIIDSHENPEGLRRASLESQHTIGQAKRSSITELGTSPRATYLLRRTSSAAGQLRDPVTVQMRSTDSEMRQHLKHLGPSNLASRPKQTRYNTVKIKPAGALTPEASARSSQKIDTPTSVPQHAPDGGIGAGLLRSAGKEAADGVYAVQTGYGSFDRTLAPTPEQPEGSDDHATGLNGSDAEDSRNPRSARRGSNASHSTINSIESRDKSRPISSHKRGNARSGSITENIIEAGGFKKMILETTSSSSDTEERANGHTSGGSGDRAERDTSHPANTNGDEPGAKKKRRRKKKKSRAKSSESTPLLGGDDGSH
ncbi:MAG: hypothetical protein M1819_001762 [Sarea resinae]|nr:MAG: hypothetical protein M1819_001762 [Sarea resinae]